MKKFLIQTVFFLITIFLINHAVVWWYEAPQRKAIKEGTHKKFLKWNAMQSNPDTYEVILLGSSRGYCAYDPKEIDAITGSKSFNMCTGSQNVIESYYYLKEILRYQKPKTVVYETFLPSFSPSPDNFNVFSNASFMSLSGKKEMIFNEFKGEAVMNILFPIFKHKYYLRRDLSNRLKSGKVSPESSNRWEKGYFYSEKVVSDAEIGNFSPIYNFDNSVVSLENVAKYLGLMHSLCKENNIEFICVRAPYPPTRLKISKSDTVHDYFADFYKKRNIPFYDFNYSEKEKYFDQDFTDYHHMNNSGDKKVSKELAEKLLVGK
ncbi:MAG: hypothetical protein AB3N14_18530 [Flavobacteriaceae bacterium]